MLDFDDIASLGDRVGSPTFPIDDSTPRKPMAVNKQADEIIVWDDPPSSPFLTDAGDASRQLSAQWNQGPTDPEIDAIFSGAEEKENAAPDNATMEKKLSTPKKRQAETTPPGTSVRPSQELSMPPPSTTKRSRSTSPEKASLSRGAPTAQTPLYTRGERANPSATKSFTFRDDNTFREDPSLLQDETNIDDTCFSTFSAIPEMTVFAKLGDNRHSPSKRDQTPRQFNSTTPQTLRRQQSDSRSPSPTPRRQRSPTKDGNTTSLLLDFTQQMETFTTNERQTPSRGGRLSPSRTEPNLLSFLNNQRSPVKDRRQTISPTKQSSLLNLLDFELPPPPTPRSTPAFSVREVESLKSSFQSQLSSIKAKLSGKEAEVDSLKKALEDAERRVGEAQEASRDEKMKREQAEQEKADWEQRGLDVEKVLGTVKEEIMKSETEKETLERRAEESERRASDAEARNLDLSARLASMPTTDSSGNPTVDGEEIQRLVQAQLDAKIESVSRELHAVYKKKHETKVATLKKSYEARSEKKCMDLQARVDELSKQNEDLIMVKDNTFSGEIPTGHVSQEEHAQARQAADMYRAQIEEQNARFAGLDQEMSSMKSEQARLVQELEKERVEKGELVAAVDEMLMLQATDAPPAVIEDFRKSISRTSGLKPPVSVSGSAAESRIGRGGIPGVSRAGSGQSKMMSNIQRMGGASRGM